MSAEISTLIAGVTCQFLRPYQHQEKQQHCHRHFLVHSCQRHISRFGRNCKSNDISIWWLFGCLLLGQLLFATRTTAKPDDNNVYLRKNTNHHISPLPPNIADVSSGQPSPTLTGESIEENSLIQHKGGHRQYVSVSDIDKEVVERLIKQWAPVVWLAPEEKFMPLGVEEFLANVHPESKDKAFTPGMPIGDSSEKSYLVTNAEVDQLLQNEASFIYGRNPNVSPVPIYAVVTLCNIEQQIEHKPLPAHVHIDTVMEPIAINVQQPPSQRLSYSSAAQIQPVSAALVAYAPSHLELPKATRGPYIPVTLGPKDQLNNTIRRSSRLYPVFQRVKRDVTPANAKYISQPPPISHYDLVMGESAPTAEMGAAPALSQSTMPPDGDSEENENINNFIANLADNVKFSIPFNNQEAQRGNNKVEPHLNYAYREGTPVPSFHVTFWMFYPYSQGKNMCTLSLGPFGRIPFPAVYGYCLGRKKDIGSHIGDWEHMTLYFTGSAEPEAMYVSAHDAGAYYTYNRLTGSFEFKRQETRKGILQRPNFPKTVTTFNDHPVLFAAKGSHGLWTAPGKHRFVKVARLYDINGFGTPWNTWKSVDISYENLKSYGRSLAPTWLSFKGRWGNPKSKCHPLRRVGLNFCEFTDGPTGIPLKEPHFQCGATYRRR